MGWDSPGTQTATTSDSLPFALHLLLSKRCHVWIEVGEDWGGQRYFGRKRCSFGGRQGWWEKVFFPTGEDRERHSNCQAGGRNWRIRLLILWAKPSSLSEVQSWGSGNIKGMGLVGTVCSGWPWVHSLTTLTSVPLCVHLNCFPLWYRVGIGYKEILQKPLAQGTHEAMLAPFTLYWVPWYAFPPQLKALSSLHPHIIRNFLIRPSEGSAKPLVWLLCPDSSLSVPKAGHLHFALTTAVASQPQILFSNPASLSLLNGFSEAQICSWSHISLKTYHVALLRTGYKIKPSFPRIVYKVL